ncbi:MAG: rhodanese-like domain-containing protein [Paludibacteraceae bacterium]|nr:rhodanese-like domain-containing protein [Paludibacteraceae bacterium]
MRFKTFLISLAATLGITACAQQNYTDVELADFIKLIERDDVQIVDVRTPEEFAQSHIPGAINIDYKNSKFKEKAQRRLDPTRPVAIYCRTGRRSALASAQLMEIANFQIYNLKGGIVAWQNANQDLDSGPCEAQ